MTVDEVEKGIANLKQACLNVGIIKFNRFYFHDPEIVFNVNYEGVKASVKLINDELIITKSNRKVSS